MTIPAKIMLELNDCFDRIFSFLILIDYDWMHYRLQAQIPIKEKQMLNIEFAYFGDVKSSMYAELNGSVTEYIFDSNIFKEYISKYIKKHANQWNETYAFNGDDIVIEFYNNVMENHIKSEKCNHKIHFPIQ